MAARKDQAPTFTAFIGFNCTPEQKALLHDYAAQVGKKPSVVLREALSRFFGEHGVELCDRPKKALKKPLRRA